MLKKTISLTMALLIMLSCPAAFADTAHRYGDKLQKYTMYTELSSSVYWYIYKGKGCVELSEDKAFKGKTSMKIDVQALMDTDAQRFTFHTTPITVTDEMRHNSLYYEFYVNGNDCNGSDIRFYAYYDDNFYKYFNIEPPDENGWVKVWALLPGSYLTSCDTCEMAVDYIPTASVNPSDYIYLDEMSIRLAPQNISALDFTCSDNTLDLNDIRVFGLDDNNNKEVIMDSALIDWEIVSGNAYISNSSLVYDDNKSGDVVLRASFFGVSCEVAVHFKPELELNSVLDNGEQCTVNLLNNTNSGMPVKLITTVYNDGRLYSVKVSNYNLNRAENVIEVSKPRMPVSIENPSANIIVINSRYNKIIEIPIN